MTDETKEMRDARHALERLAASDPAAQANMLRFVAATAIMLTGRRGADGEDGLLIGAGFRLLGDSVQLAATPTREDGADSIYIAFDVDDAAGPPVGLGLFRKEGDNVMCYGLCRLWSPANDGRALLVPADDGSLGHFAYKSGATLRHLDGMPPGDAEAGFRRARSRLARLLDSDEVRARDGGGYMHLVRNEGAEIRRWTSRLAA